MSPIPQEQVLAAYQRAPQIIRDTFNSEVTAGVIMDIKARYRLHVDVAGNLGAEIGYLLLGLRNPTEFFGSLMLAGTDEQSARGIMDEVNSRIFIPLKNRIRSGSVQQVPSVSDATQQAPSPSNAPLVRAPALDYVPPTYPTLPGSDVPVPNPAAHAPLPQVTPDSQPTAVPRAPAISVPAPASPLRKDFGADPYREPI